MQSVSNQSQLCCVTELPNWISVCLCSGVCVCMCVFVHLCSSMSRLRGEREIYVISDADGFVAADYDDALLHYHDPHWNSAVYWQNYHTGISLYRMLIHARDYYVPCEQNIATLSDLLNDFMPGWYLVILILSALAKQLCHAWLINSLYLAILIYV